ncbi:sensor histidine kinase [Pararhizobium mangrovi]|uniref:histidine kinase n=1 Tax=Pararhizobium mangrovi TaxID=2590452 RepID=A0A506U831_9HYPH|nr:ATP-binding protein [Pararhizobium mangrovi]TPW29638.1 sensor histidine kinase [Pararhizobium mangrovi]
MDFAPGQPADKNIVDRSRASANAPLTRAIRATREKLQTGTLASGPQFRREMTLLHANALLQNAAAAPLLVILAGALSVYFLHTLNLVAWVIVTLVVYAGVTLVARRTPHDLSAADSSRWRRRFLAAHIVVGLCWTWFAVIGCADCDGPAFLLLKGLMLLVALAMTAMSSFTIRGAVPLAFTPPVAALAVEAALTRGPYEIGIFAVMAGALGFFEFVAGRMHDSHVKLLSFQSEKDSLIAELEVANSLSDEARRRAEEANLAKSRFLASMSHELRTPLNAILGFSQVMKDGVLGPMENDTYRDYVGDIHRSGAHLLDLINEILDLSRIEAGRYELQEEAIELRELAEDCIGMVQLRARAKDITITSRFEQKLPAVWVDERALRQVVLNLLSNAVKFTPQNGSIEVKVGWTAGGGQYVSIKDNGPGIPEEEIPLVLSAFGQGAIAIKSAEQGTGLGLPIVQAVLDKHDGEFVLRSKLRRGTEAIAILPPRRVLESVAPIDQEAPRRKVRANAGS